MKRVLIFVLFLAVLAGGGLAALPFVLSPGFIGEQMQAAVKKATGRTLEISGEPKLSYWPELAVEMDGVSLSNPPGMFDGKVAQINRLRVRVAALPLLSRKLEIKEITLVKPSLSLVLDGNGQPNWAFGNGNGASNQTGAEGKAKDYMESVSVAPVVIEDGELKYLDERSGAVFAASDVDMTIAMPQLSSPLQTKGALTWNRERVNLTLFVKDPTRLGGEGSPLDVAVKSRLIEFIFNGRGVLRNGLALAGNLDMKTPSLRGLAKWAGKPLEPGKGLEPFAVKGAIDLEGKTIKLSKARLSLDEMNAQGSIAISLAGARPMITANLGVDRINANAYASPSGTGSQTGAIREGWSEKPISFAGLKALDAKLSLAVAQIIHGDVVAGRTNVHAELDDGLMTATLQEMQFYDGKAHGKLVLNGREAKPSIQASFTSTGLDGYRLLADFAKLERISGVTGVNLAVTATGASQQELVSTLAGKTSFRFNDGALRGLNVAKMIRNVQNAVLGGWDVGPEQKTDFSVLEASFDIRDGIAENKDLRLLGPLVRITGGGEIDLLRQRLDYRTEPKLVASLEGQGGAAELAGIAVPIIIKGPWHSPKIYPDIEGILENPEAAFKALAKLTGGKVDLDKAKEKLENKAKKIQEKALKKVEEKVAEEAKKLIGEEAAKVLGEDVSDTIEKEGGALLNDLLGFGKKKQPAEQSQ